MNKTLVYRLSLVAVVTSLGLPANKSFAQTASPAPVTANSAVTGTNPVPQTVNSGVTGTNPVPQSASTGVTGTNPVPQSVILTVLSIFLRS